MMVLNSSLDFVYFEFKTNEKELPTHATLFIDKNYETVILKLTVWKLVYNVIYII